MKHYRSLELLLLFVLAIVQIVAVRKCVENCNSTINLGLPPTQLKIVQNKTIVVTIETFVESVDVKLGVRKYSNELVLNSFGIHPEISENVFMPPPKEEFQEWIKRGQCQIGHVCEPEGTCWGSSAQLCRDNSLKRWVYSSQFKYSGVRWTKDLYRTCIKDWECSIREMNYQLFIDGVHGPYIRAGSKNTYLSATKETFEVVDQTSLYIGKIPNRKEEREISCLELNGEHFCEIKTEENGVQIVSFLSGSTCTILRNSKICIKKGQQTYNEYDLKEQETYSRSVILADLKIIEEEMRASFVQAMYNDLMIRGMIQNIMEVLNKVIHSSSRYNNMILSDIFNLDISTEWSPYGLKVCSCMPASNESCKWSQSVLKSGQSTGSCGSLPINVTTYNLYGEENLNVFMPDHLTLKTVGKTILETLQEQELMLNKKFNEESTNNNLIYSPTLTALGFSSITEMIWKFLPLANLVLIFWILATRERR